MDATAAKNQRHEFIRDACVFFRTCWRRHLVRITGNGTVAFKNASDRLHWETLHNSADAVVRRYYQAKDSPF